MKRGFTLIEIIVAVVVVALTSSGALLYLNQFNTRQKLEKAKEEVVASIKLVQSYAKTRQLPLGSSESELRYVQVQILPGGYLVAGANGIGSTFFREKVYEGNNLMVGLTPAVLYFWPGSGFLSHDIFGTMFRNDEIAKVVIQSQNNLIGYNEVTIDALGQIVGNNYIEGLSSIDFPGLTPTPAPTSSPTPQATPTSSTCLEPFSYCFDDSQCCSHYCSFGRCAAIDGEPTPTIRYVTPTIRYVTPTIRYVTPTIVHQI